MLRPIQSLDAIFLSADLLKLLIELSRADRSTVSLGDVFDSTEDDDCFGIGGAGGMGGGRGGGGGVNEDAEIEMPQFISLFRSVPSAILATIHKGRTPLSRRRSPRTFSTNCETGSKTTHFRFTYFMNGA